MIKFSESEKAKTWTIGHKFHYDVKTKTRSSYGKCFILNQRKRSPNKLYFDIKKYHIKNGAARNRLNNKYYSFVVKNNKLQVFQILKDVTVKIRTINSNLIELSLEHEKKTFFQSFLKVLKEFLKENNCSYLPKWKVQNYLEFIQEIALCANPNLRLIKDCIKTEWGVLPKEVSVFRKCNSLKDVVKEVTGTKGKLTTKLLLKAFKEKDISYLRIKHIKKLVPIEVVQEILDEGAYKTIKKTCGEKFRKFIKEFSQERRTELIRTAFSSNFGHFVRDTIKSYNAVKLKIPNFVFPYNIKYNWDSLHDYIYLEHLKLKRQEDNIPFEYEEDDKKINGAVLEDIKIELPEDSIKLLYYGQKLNHCVGTYSDAVKNKWTKIFGIYKKEELKYCVQITDGKVVQFRGWSNSLPDEIDKELTVKILKDYKIIYDKNLSNIVC